MISPRTLIFCLVFFLAGCSVNPEPKASHIADQNIPLAVILEDEAGGVIGKGTQFQEDIYIAPDHLWQQGGKLYADGYPIKVLVRDFRHDLLFFRTASKPSGSALTWVETPPGVGTKLFWHDGNRIHEVHVMSTKGTFATQQVEIEQLMTVDDTLSHGDSGSAVFDEKGHIHGILIATDLVEGVSYFVRGDRIRALAEEYLEDL